mmetsp:Transcript_4992/g.5883  ORF Transcript_4992/g.5883 Transcript_4992/m.5883 type:complete len:81 (-) Transcript_4992:52-294(-)
MFSPTRTGLAHRISRVQYQTLVVNSPREKVTILASIMAENGDLEDEKRKPKDLLELIRLRKRSIIKKQCAGFDSTDNSDE